MAFLGSLNIRVSHLNSLSGISFNLLTLEAIPIRIVTLRGVLPWFFMFLVYLKLSNWFSFLKTTLILGVDV